MPARRSTEVYCTCAECVASNGNLADEYGKPIGRRFPSNRIDAHRLRVQRAVEAEALKVREEVDSLAGEMIGLLITDAGDGQVSRSSKLWTSRAEVQEQRCCPTPHEVSISDIQAGIERIVLSGTR